MKVYRRLFGYVPEVMACGYGAMALSSLAVVLVMAGYYDVYRFLKALLVDGAYGRAGEFAAGIAAWLMAGGLMYLLSGVLSHILAFRLETNLRKRGIDGLTEAGFRFFDLHASGYIRKTIDDNAKKTHTAVAHMLPDNCQAVLTPVLTLVLAFVVSPYVGWVILTLAVVSALILKGMMGNGEFMRRYQAALDRLSAETVEYIRGMPVIKIFGARLRSFKTLHAAIMDYSKYAYDYSISCKKPYVRYQLMMLGLVAILAIPLGVALPSVHMPEKAAADLIMVFFLSGVLMVAVMKIMWASMYMFNAKYALDHLEGLYESMQADRLSYGSRQSFDSADIVFDHVTFSYGDKKVLEDVSFTLKEKKTYALVGPSGSGKSTIAKLLSGFYRVDGGRIKIGGHALEDYTKEAIVRNIAFVFQDCKLFKKSIYDNVALADAGATRSRVMEALRMAGCDPILDKLPQRENTVIGSKGVYLSGGEKQRIAIARAILKNASIVVLDEAGASIDADNEYELQKAFKNLMRDKTVIMIAHRLPGIRFVDEILVLDGGRVAERGSHDALMARGGVYAGLVGLYAKANDWRVTDESLL